jgi:hypothetical protein
MRTIRLTLLGFACSSLFGCGREQPMPPAGPDSVVALTITAAQKVPPAGSGGSFTLRWTEVLSANGAGGATVQASRSELRESHSQTVMSFTGLRPGRSVSAGASLELPVVVAGVDAALYPGKWELRESVDILHPSGRVETVQAVHSFD